MHFRAFRFQIFLGGMPPDPPIGNGPCGPFSGHSRLLHLQWPLVTKVIEAPDIHISFHILNQSDLLHILVRSL